MNALWLVGGLILTGLLVLAGALVLAVYWRLVQRPTPKLDGAATLPGLSAAVEALRDKHGIPHIYAANLSDVLRAQGYLHAQDRLWQMEQNRRIAQGRLAEVFGPLALDVDRFSRIVGFYRAAALEADQLDEVARGAVDAYVQGINAYMAAHPGRLGAEFNLLRVTPEPWTVDDVIGVSKVMAWMLSVNWEGELTRLQLVQKFGPLAASELEPEYPAQNPAILEGVGSQESMRLLSVAGLLLNEYEKIRRWVGQPQEGMGSNAWAVAPKASATRRAMLCNDPHLGLQIPGVWYENHLECPELRVSGASLPGMPGVVIGHNQEIAWGITNAFVDSQDLYVERAHPERPLHFAFGDEWYGATVVEEIIHVRRQAEPHVEQVVITRHGPLISRWVKGEASLGLHLALRWTGHDPGQNVRAMMRLNQAGSWAEFQAALAEWSSPPQNFVYADADGNIGYLLAGRVPLRRYNLGLMPAPGWDGAHEWQGSIPPTELPRSFNPPSGKIVSANHKIVGDDYHHFLGMDFLPGWRAARIEELLNEKERLSLRDMEEIQLDTGSKFAAALAPFFAQLNSDDPFVRVAISHLRKWNHRMDADSIAALIFQYALIGLLDEVYGGKLEELRDDFFGISSTPLFLINGFSLRVATRLQQLIREQLESPWYTDVKTGRHRTRDEVLYAALAQAVMLIRSELGDNALRWNWGRMHQARYVHPLGSMRLFRGLFNRGPFPVGGDATTPNQTYHAPRLPLGLVQVTASYRQVFEVGEWDTARSVTTSGQSGHPMSEQYADQITMWREGVYHAMPWSRPAVEAAARFRMTLYP